VDSELTAHSQLLHFRNHPDRFIHRFYWQLLIFLSDNCVWLSGIGTFTSSTWLVTATALFAYCGRRQLQEITASARMID